jgi:hypothetical protein
MTTFGDFEPEDSWHPEDPIPILIDNLFRRLALLERDDELVDRRVLLDVIEHRAARQRLRRDLSVADLVRLQDLADDLELIRAML